MSIAATPWGKVHHDIADLPDCKPHRLAVFRALVREAGYGHTCHPTRATICRIAKVSTHRAIDGIAWLAEVGAIEVSRDYEVRSRRAFSIPSLRAERPPDASGPAATHQRLGARPGRASEPSRRGPEPRRAGGALQRELPLYKEEIPEEGERNVTSKEEAVPLVVSSEDGTGRDVFSSPSEGEGDRGGVACQDGTQGWDDDEPTTIQEPTPPAPRKWEPTAEELSAELSRLESLATDRFFGRQARADLEAVRAGDYSSFAPTLVPTPVAPVPDAVYARRCDQVEPDGSLKRPAPKIEPDPAVPLGDLLRPIRGRSLPSPEEAWEFAAGLARRWRDLDPDTGEPKADSIDTTSGAVLKLGIDRVSGLVATAETKRNPAKWFAKVAGKAMRS